jgi:hypothetical protein
MILLKLNELSASLRVVPLPPLVRVSDSTSAATNESGRTFYFSIGGVDYGSGGSLSAVSAAMGMYHACFSASKISVTGPGMVYYGLPNSSGTALQVSAPFMVVPIDSYDSMRAGLFALPNAAAEASGGLITHGTGTGQLHTSNGSVGLKAQAHSGATIKGIENYANISSVTLNAGTHSGATVQGVSNYANFPLTSVATSVWSTLRSNFTTPGSFGEYTYSQVTGISTGTVFGITDTSNFPSGSGATAGEVARAVWANSGRTLEGVSIATVFVNPGSVWSALRSAYTTPGSFGEYVYSQVTGTSSGTVQGVTRALNLSANGDKTGYSISGTKTTLDALNDIDGSGVTLHAGVHSGATVQGIDNYRNISNVTLHAGTHSNVTIQGVTRVNSGVTLNADTHSGATIAGIVSGGIIAATLASGVLTSAKFAAGAIDAAALATDAGQEIADSLLGRNIAGGSSTGRIVSEALYPLRNRSLIQGSVGTVYQVDDATSSWTFSPSLGTAPIAGIDPLGP